MRRTSLLTLLASLYFAQGLPFGFFVQVLPVILRERGVSLVAIGLSSMLAVPWALKFLWAPWVDRGPRRRWVLRLQFLSAAILMVMAWVGTSRIGPLLVACFVLNLVSATQDIATDGLAVESLPRAWRGWANGLQVAGYRVGMIVGGGLLLLLLAWVGDRGAFLVLALLTLLATLPAARWREASRPRRSSSRPSLRAFVARPGMLRWLALLVAYKAGDAGAVAMLRPFAIDRGLTLADIGWLLGTVGFLCGLVGALVGGGLTVRLGHRRALVCFGVFQAMAVGAYALVALHDLDLRWLTLGVALEHLAGGMATAALFTAMMDRCDRARAGTDYTIQASAVVLATGFASAVAGVSAQTFGYTGHFLLCAVAAAVAAAAVATASSPRATRTEVPGTGGAPQHGFTVSG